MAAADAAASASGSSSSQSGLPSFAVAGVQGEYARMLGEARQKLKQQNGLLKRLALECTRLKQQLAEAEGARQSAHDQVLDLPHERLLHRSLRILSLILCRYSIRIRRAPGPLQQLSGRIFLSNSITNMRIIRKKWRFLNGTRARARER